MIYFETNQQNAVSYIHYMPFDPKYGLGKSEEELKKTGYLVDSLPDYSEEIPEGKKPELHYDGSEFSWVLIDAPQEETDLQQEIEFLKAQQDATNEALLGLMDMIALQ